MDTQARKLEDEAASSTATVLQAYTDESKRQRDPSPGPDDESHHATTTEHTSAPKAKKKKTKAEAKESKMEDTPAILNPYPYFYYTDHSRERDGDPDTPVSTTGSISFPMKMHAILAKPELEHIIAWDAHGRSFRILKPKIFERETLPRYFEHSKFSSFTRQVNGWGFRSLSEGENRGSYYNELFLRGMPWLCKKMGRPKVGEKKSMDKEHEPDLVAISKQYPVPNYPMSYEVRVVIETIEKGPKEKMAENWFLSIPESEKKRAARPVPQAQPAADASLAPAAASGADPAGSLARDPAGSLAPDPASSLARDPASSLAQSFQRGNLLESMALSGLVPAGLAPQPWADAMMPNDPYGLNPGLALGPGLSAEQALRLQLHREAELKFRQIMAARNAAAMQLMDPLGASVLQHGGASRGLRGLNPANQQVSPEQLFLLQSIENNRRNIDRLSGLPSLGRR